MKYLTLFIFLTLAFNSIASADRPNIVVLLCDDLGYGDLECYGHPHIKTPNLNQLAASGIRFTDFYSAAPVCSPSRVGLLTGRSPNRAGVYDWIPEGRNPRPDARDQVHMRKSESTIPMLLREAGYETCMAGKWHCNSKFNSSEQPQPGDFGFDHWLATQNNASPSHENPRNFVRNGEPVGKVDAFSCQYVVDEAINWLDTLQGEKPFFLYVPFHEPHEPVASPKPLVDEYRKDARDDDEAQYFANVANIDNAVGRLIQALEKQDRRDNTLVIFTSDNGPETLDRYKSANRSYGTPGPLRGMKLHTTEAGFRVAGLLSWPSRVKPGQVISDPVSSLDFLPSFCQLANAPLPTEVKLDGVSFLKIFDGEKIMRPKPLIWAYFNAINEHRVAMRDGDWKVLAKLDGGSFDKMVNITRETLDRVTNAELTDIEIYNLSNDMDESKNVSSQNPSVTKELSEKLEKHYRELVTTSHVW